MIAEVTAGWQGGQMSNSSMSTALPRLVGGLGHGTRPRTGSAFVVGVVGEQPKESRGAPAAVSAVGVGRGAPAAVSAVGVGVGVAIVRAKPVRAERRKQQSN